MNFSKNILIQFLISSLVCSTIFNIVSPPLSYLLFFIFVSISILITHTVCNETHYYIIHTKLTVLDIHYILMFSGVLLLIMNLLGFYIPIVNMILYFLVFVLSPGFSIMQLLQLKIEVSYFVYLSIVYSISTALISIFGVFALIVPSSMRSSIVTLVLVLLSLYSMIINRNKEKETDVCTFFTMENSDLILIFNILLFIIFYLTLYPELNVFTSLDISRNYLFALGLTKNEIGDFYFVNKLYPLFSVYQSTVFYAIKPDINHFQMIEVFLNIFIILSFYAMANQYLKKYGKYKSVFATLVWSTFAGLGWLFYILQKINYNISFFSEIYATNSYSYGDVLWRRLFFNLSMETSFALVFILLFLLKRDDISKNKQLFLMSLLITPLTLLHPYGNYLLISLFLFFAIFGSKKIQYNLKNASYSMLISSFLSLIIKYTLNYKILESTLNIFTIVIYILASLTIAIILKLNNLSSDKPYIFIRRLLSIKSLNNIIIALLFILYFSSIISWFSGSLNFDFSNLNRIGYVPWVIYPIKLGVMGLLAIMSLYVLFNNANKYSKDLAVFYVSFIFMIFFSRFISYVQLQYVHQFTFYPQSPLFEAIKLYLLNFREERMFEFFKPCLAVISSLVFSKHISTKNDNSIRQCIVVGVVSIVLISGISSVLLGFEYYNKTSNENQPDLLEIDIINNLQNIVYEDGKSLIISIRTAASNLDFTGATALIGESLEAWSSKSPEFPLFVTRYTTTTPTYFYFNKNVDYPELSYYSGNYLEHIANLTQVCLENQAVQIKVINNITAPTPKSKTALLIPYNVSSSSIVDPTNLVNFEYAELALFFGKQTQQMSYSKFPVYYNNVINESSAVFNGKDSYIRVNGTDTNFTKIVIEFEFQPYDINKNQIIVSKFDWGIPSQKSWEVLQNGKRIVFKLSYDGAHEEMLLTDEVLNLGQKYNVRCEYDGSYMKIYINNNVKASKPYVEGIYQSNVDIMIGAELRNNIPVSLAEIKLNYIQVLNTVPSTSNYLFYAYDFLSLTGLNYTTVILGDDKINCFETVILPYDDQISNGTIFNILHNNQSNIKNIVIINPNGFGPLINLFGDVSSETFVADKLCVDSNYDITPTNLPMITLNSSGLSAQYTDGIHSSPFVLNTTKKQLNLIYINIHPLIQSNQFNNQYLFQDVSEIMKSYCDIINETTVSLWFQEPSLLFSELTVNGKINILSDSVLFAGLQNNDIIVNYDKITNITVSNMNNLDLDTYDTIQIDSTEISVDGGYGFYTMLTAVNPTLILHNNGNVCRILVNEKIVEGAAIKLKFYGNISFMMRQPKITIDGDALFQNVHMMHSSQVYTDGRSTSFSGNMTLDIYVSDEYTIGIPFKFNSPITVKYLTPLVSVDEINLFRSLIPSILLVLIITSSLMLILDMKLNKGTY